MSFWRPTLAVTVVVGALLAAPALADTRVTAAAVDRFINPDVSLVAGQTLVFASQDPLQKHTLTAVGDGPDGNPLFNTPAIGAGSEVPVTGTASLAPGTYDFFCTIHPATMRGVLTVTDSGSAPASGGPQVLAKLGTAPLRTVLKRGHMFATITLSEASSVVLNVRARGTTIATTTTSLRAGTSRAQLNLTPKGAKALAGHKTVRFSLSVRVVDADGNQAHTTAHETLHR